MPTQDQVVWASVNILTASGSTPFTRGSLLPEPRPEEAESRALLRLGGAIRTVEVVFTQEELAEQAGASAAATAARVSAHDVDPGLPSGEQIAGTAQPGPPTLESAGHTPVVIGSDDNKPKTAAKPAVKPAGR
jgi:hypothetical protein